MESRIDLLIKAMARNEHKPEGLMMSPIDLEKMLVAAAKTKGIDLDLSQYGTVVNELVKPKGVMLCGAVGIGKTTILQSFADVYRIFMNDGLVRNQIRFISTHKLLTEYKANGDSVLLDYEKHPLIIDDIGNEPDVVNSFGTKTNPVKTLLFLRYENKARTYCTTNLHPKQFREKYGDRLYDRFKEMFTIITMKGESRR